MGDHRPRRRATNLQDGFSNHGSPNELSIQGVPVKGGDADRYEGTLPTPQCQGHRDNTGGGQLPPPTVPPVQHSGALEGY